MGAAGEGGGWWWWWAEAADLMECGVWSDVVCVGFDVFFLLVILLPLLLILNGIHMVKKDCGRKKW